MLPSICMFHRLSTSKPTPKLLLMLLEMCDATGYVKETRTINTMIDVKPEIMITIKLKTEITEECGRQNCR